MSESAWSRDNPQRYDVGWFDRSHLYRRVLDLFAEHQSAFFSLRTTLPPGPPFREWWEVKDAAEADHRLFWQRDGELHHFFDQARNKRAQNALAICLQAHRAYYDARASASIALLLDLGGFNNNEALLDWQAARAEKQRYESVLASNSDVARGRVFLQSRVPWWRTIRYFHDVNAAVRAARELRSRRWRAVTGGPDTIH